MSITYQKRPTERKEADFAGAVVDIVAKTPDPICTSEVAISLHGFAHKHGYDHCTWKSRFFKLNQDNLQYFKQESDSAPKGTIPLSPYCICLKTKVGEPRALNALAYVRYVDGVLQPETVTRENGVSISVPEQDRTFYIHFPSQGEQEKWYKAICTNIELLRRPPGVIEAMLKQVEPLIRPGDVPRVKYSILKMALRSRYLPRLTTATNDLFTQALQAVQANNLEALKKLFEPRFAQLTVQGGMTLLIKASVVGSAEIAAFLLQNGADPNQAKADGDTPLIVAARLNHVAVARLLLEHGADRSVSNSYRETALSEGEHKGLEMASLLKNRDIGPVTSAMSKVQVSDGQPAAAASDAS
eukprot:m.123459 g.123459  ORF g.123459 m.123459 type:complete len:357 (-) comp16252_c0_seq1:620-1690(-)